MSDLRRKASVATLGCKVNQYESQAIAEELEKLGFEICRHTQKCDVYIINTCTVTAESDRKSRQLIRRAISQNPNAFVIVTGCTAQADAARIAEIEGVDAIIGNSCKLKCASIAKELADTGNKRYPPIILVEDVDASPFEPMTITFFERTRAYVKIEDGCENNCTYCAIPASRGKVRSKPASDVLDEVKYLATGGCREIVLTGIETASYGKDLDGVDLSELLCRIDKTLSGCSIRLGSLDPSLIKEPFVKKIAPLTCLAPHFHLSLQSGCDKTLAAMKRKYNSKMALDAITLLRLYIPDVKFTTDVIVGFPGESDEDFEKTVEFVKKARFLHIHIFPYSERKGTPAYGMDGQISRGEKARRHHVLSDVQAKIKSELLRHELERAPEKQVLFETFRDGECFGHTPDFIEVRVKNDAPLHAQIRRVRLTDTDGSTCVGVLID